MNHGISVSFSPIGGSWPLLLVAIMAVTVLTLWAYAQRLRGTTGRWRWVALSLRLLAICSACWRRCGPRSRSRRRRASRLARLPDRHQHQHADATRSAANRGGTWPERSSSRRRSSPRRWARTLNLKIHIFDSTLTEPKADEKGKTTKAQGARDEAGLRRSRGQKAEQDNSKRIARMVIVSDFASNNGPTRWKPRRQDEGARAGDPDRRRGPGDRERRGRLIETSRCETSSPARPSS